MSEKDVKDDIFKFDRTLDDFFDRFHNFVRYSKYSTEPIWKPSVDLVECEEDIKIFVELAGVKKEDIKVTYSKGYIFITGVRKQPDFSHVKRVGQLEVEYGRFERIIAVGKNIDFEKISVELESGMLRIAVPFKKGSYSVKVEIE